MRMIWRLNLAYFIRFFLAFSVFTVVGTLCHEYGHIIVAKCLGYETELHHASMSSHHTTLFQEYNELFETYRFQIEHQLPFEEQENFIRLKSKIKYNSFYITIGGPIQTILTSLTGLFVPIYRQTYHKIRLKFMDWFVVYCTLFSLRQVMNLVMGISSELISPDGHYFGGDEAKLSNELGLWEGTIGLITALLGISIAVFVVFKVVPIAYRFSFILAGLLGGSIAFYLWMHVVGPFIMG